MRLLVATAALLVVSGCGSGGGSGTTAAEVDGTVDIAPSGSTGSRCVLLRDGDETYHLTPGAYTLTPAGRPTAVRASRVTADGVSTEVLRHGARIQVRGRSQEAPASDPCEAERVLSIDDVAARG